MAVNARRVALKRSLSIGVVILLWAVGSTAVGVVAACVHNYCGHGSELYVLFAWLAGGMGFVAHLLLMVTAWFRKGSDGVSIDRPETPRIAIICLIWLLGATVLGIVADLIPVLIWGPVGGNFLWMSVPIAWGIGLLGLLAHLAYTFAKMADKSGHGVSTTILIVVVLWLVPSTVVSYAAVLVSELGHAGRLFVWGASLAALATIPIYLVYLLRKRSRGKSDSAAI